MMVNTVTMETFLVIMVVLETSSAVRRGEYTDWDLGNVPNFYYSLPCVPKKSQRPQNLASILDVRYALYSTWSVQWPD